MTDVHILEKKLKRAERKVEILEKEFEDKTRELYLAQVNLKERIKELDCLYSISRIVDSAGSSLETILQQIIKIIPSSWQYSDIACARIILGDQKFTTDNWQDTKWIQSRDIVAHNQKCGSVEVGYNEQRPESDEGPFLAEERSLLDAIADRLGKIVERVRAEEKYYALFVSSRDAIMTLEPPEWKFTSGNPSTLQMFRAPDEAEFTSHGPGTVSPELQPDGRTSAEKAKEMIEAAMRDGSNFFEWTHRRFDGEDFPASVLLTRMERDGATILQATVRDITEQKKIQEELEIQTWGLSKTNESIKILYKELEEKNEKLKQFNELKSTFVANVAHEVRNPLAVVRGAFDLIDKMLGDQITDKQRQVVDMGVKTIDRLNRLVTDLLDLSKIETGKMNLNLDKVDMQALVEEILLPYDIELLKKNMTLEKNISSDVGAITADRDKLSQVIINLLNNAIKYTPDNGTVAINLTAMDDEVRCEIADSGPGIPADEREKIFNKFERVTAEKQEGTGLGLAIAKDIVTLHKGKLWVESELGKGSTFIFTLPRE